MPFRGCMDEFQGWLFDENGVFVRDSIEYRGMQPPIENPCLDLKGKLIWGGSIFLHFGHCIWETLSRLYCIRKCGSKFPVVFISPNKNVRCVRTLFKMLGIKNKIVLIDRPTTVEQIFYSPPGSSICPLQMSREQVDALSYFDCDQQQGLEKVWISRSALQEWQHKDKNEAVIENELKNIGFTIIHPEKIPVKQQVDIIASSRLVAGFDGSAWFSLFFARKIFSRAVIFNRFEAVVDTVKYLMEIRNIEHEIHELPVGVDEFDQHKSWQTWQKNYYHLHPEKIVEILNEITV